MTRRTNSLRAYQRLYQRDYRKGQLRRTEPIATTKPTLIDIAWAAGLYEGEGTVNACGLYNLQLSLGQKDDWILHRLRALFGGNVSGGPHTRNKIYFWCVSGGRAVGFLLTVFSFLSPRRRAQVLVAMRKRNYIAA